jgi:2-dehydro-3-deoxyphosphogluconate aldolase/(4S)-4-hydroxy-2-oxoglutarate aldolase
MPDAAGSTLEDLLRRTPVLSVLTVEAEEDAAPLARALALGGLTTLEVTLRTPAALGAIRRITQEVDGVTVGAGTVLRPSDLEAAVAAGAAFAASPGLTPELRRCCSPVPLLPGVATAGEAMTAADCGYHVLKFFPAAPLGGAAVLQAFASPLPHLRFCPTGGIGPANAAEFLRLGNVICVGGGWMARRALIKAARWNEITRLAAAACALRAPAT